MTEDIKDSIKSKLWDLKFNPFMSTYILSWTYINMNFILILFTSDLKIKDKINELDRFPINYTDSIVIAMAYVLIYPLAKTAFFAVGLWYKMLINKVEILIRNETPIPQKKINEILHENVKLQNDYEKSLIKLESIKDEYKIKTITLEDKFKEEEKKYNEYITNERNNIEDTVRNKVQIETEYLSNQISELENIITSLKNTEKDLEHKLNIERGKNNHIQNTNNESQNLANQIINKNIKIDLSSDEIKLLKIIYERNIGRQNQESYINLLLQANQFQRIKIQSLLESLTKKGIVEVEPSANHFHDITTEGKEIILKLFDEEHNKPLEEGHE